MIYVALTEKEASALRRSMPRPMGAATDSHWHEHEKAVRKIRNAENGWGQALYRPVRKHFER